ncbi:MAG: lactate utilization protein, partial [Desulfohalobiaceae bacterium]|nr:lactate utilization protein [Desulfohalobiaceae bacterium]
LHQELVNRADLETIDTYDTSLTPEETIERRRRSLLVDLFITGTNAVTQEGHLVNLDGLGNRVAALTFGPRHVVLLIGRNKVVPGLSEAHSRIKDYAALVNTVRLGKNTPCTKSMQCEDCNSPERICNTWTITEKCFIPKRIKIILINQDLGF